MDPTIVYFLSFLLSAFVILCLLCIPIVLCIIPIVIARRKYHNTSYYKSTKKSYWDFDKGTHGEYLLYERLQFLEQYGWKFLFNVYIPKRDGQTTEIDLLLISPKGIFVIESKNYSGWVLGDENETSWTQAFPNGERYEFYNPIKQNNGHIYHLKTFLNRDIPLYSIVAFSDRCTLKQIRVQSNDVYVTYYSNVHTVIDKIYNQTPTVYLNQDAIQNLYNTLYSYSQASDERKYQHAESAYAARFASQLNCPLCGGRLTLRTTQQGKNKGSKFYGCSNFPQCQYRQHIDL